MALLDICFRGEGIGVEKGEGINKTPPTAAGQSAQRKKGKKFPREVKGESRVGGSVSFFSRGRSEVGCGKRSCFILYEAE